MAQSKPVAEQTLEVLVAIRKQNATLVEQNDQLQRTLQFLADKAAIAELRQCNHMAQGTHLLYISICIYKERREKKTSKKQPKAPTRRA